MKELFSVKKFAESSPELYTAFKDYFDHTQSLRGVVGKTFSDESLDVKEKVINKLFAEEVEKRSGISADSYNGDLQHYALNPMVKSFADAIQDQMIDMIIPETLMSSVGLFAEIRFVDWGDSATFDLENNGLYNVAKAGFRQEDGDFQRLAGGSATLAPVNHQISTITDLYSVLTGRQSIAKDMMKAVRSIESEMLNEAYTAMTTAVTNASTPSALKVTNYTEKGAIKLAEIVTTYNGGNKAIFAGTPSALKSILPTNANYRYLLSDEYVKLGHVQTFNDYDVIPMSQVADYKSNNYGLKLDDTKILVLSPSADKLVKIVVGGTLSHTSPAFGNADMSQTGTITKAWETAVITNSVAGYITA